MEGGAWHRKGFHTFPCDAVDEKVAFQDCGVGL